MVEQDYEQQQSNSEKKVMMMSGGSNNNNGDGKNNNCNNALGYPVLKPQVPVPSDIEVSHSIVKGVGLLPVEDVARQYVLRCE